MVTCFHSVNMIEIDGICDATTDDDQPTRSTWSQFQFRTVLNLVIYGHYLALEQTIIHHLGGTPNYCAIFFLNRISKQLSTQQFIVDEMNVWMKKKSNIKCKQFLASNEKSEEKKIGQAKSLCIWTNENWELKCYSGHKTGNNSIVVNER